MKPAEQPKELRRALWTAAFILHALLVWIGLEVFGDSYLWVMDPQHPWIKDRFVPPLTTLMNLPTGLVCAGVVCLLAYAVGRLGGNRGFGMGRYLAVASVVTFALALLRGNFVVITGPFWFLSHSQDWHFRSVPERVVMSAVAAVGLVVIEGTLLRVVPALTRLSGKRAPATIS